MTPRPLQPWPARVGHALRAFVLGSKQVVFLHHCKDMSNGGENAIVGKRHAERALQTHSPPFAFAGGVL